PRQYLIPFVVFFSLIGAYIGQNNPTELLIMIGTGLFATLLRFGGYPLPPLIIGFILGGMLEDNLGRAMRKAGGMEFLWERPMTLGILVVAAVLFFYPIIKDRLQSRRA
ncbi:MAG: tripartite tricarboxylate transporter permease, partial [Litorivicinus sp.]